MATATVRSCTLLPVVSVREDENVVAAAKKLRQFQDRRIFVTNKKGAPIGIISIVDINDRIVAAGKDPKKVKVKEIMSYPLHLVIDIHEPVKEVAKKMVLRDNYYCPIVEKGVLKGMISYAQLLKCASLP